MSCFVVDPTLTYALGIDEAGRGPVLGPMVYACASCPVDVKDTLRSRGYRDSKQLSEGQRESLFEEILRAPDIDFEACILSAEELSNKMLRATKYNLNRISHDTAADLIQRTLDKGVPLAEVYVDTVGDPAKYELMLSKKFPGVKISVAKKADHLFPIVSAASIVAKVIRDLSLRTWQFKEQDLTFSRDFGSGYPADPITKQWLKENLEPLFGYPTLIRFSWSTIDNMLETQNAHVVAWEAECLEDGKAKKDTKLHKRAVDLAHRASSWSFAKSDRWSYYAKRNMHSATLSDF